MLRLLLLVALGFLIYYMLRRPKPRQRDRSPKPLSRAPTELVQDPTCKTYLPRDKAIVFGEHYFCSPECRDKFKEK